MRDLITLVLGGGQGTRLYPLTKHRSKPAVPLGGKYRLIDIPLSNCINSGLNRIYVLTQFNSVSLHAHIRRTYHFDLFSNGFVELLAAQQTIENTDWYQGTADAVRQNLRYVHDNPVGDVLILSGDQLYRMDYRELYETHKRTNADITLCALPVKREETLGLGVMRVDDQGKILGFVEKPKTPEELAPAVMEPEWFTKQGIEAKGRDCLANMGIYLFKRETLVQMLEKTSARDFGKELFPSALKTHHLQTHLFDGYWEDIGTIPAFYKASLDLASSHPPFDLVAAHAPIYSRARFLPPSRMEGAVIRNSLIADGCRIGPGTVIENSSIGLRCQIGRNVTIRNSVIMGIDFYETNEQTASSRKAGLPPYGIGDGTYIDGAIIDKNCRIGQNVRIINEQGLHESEETAEAMICEGVVVVNKGVVLPNGWRLM